MSAQSINRRSRPTKTVKLSAPVDWFNQQVSEIVIEEPSAKTFLELGMPQLYVHHASGGGVVADNPEALNAYLDKCCKVENASQLMTLLSLQDGLAVKEAITSFFTDARLRMSAG